MNLDGPHGNRKYWCDLRRSREIRQRRNFGPKPLIDTMSSRLRKVITNKRDHTSYPLLKKIIKDPNRYTDLFAYMYIC